MPVLTISFTPSSPLPNYGYTVKYRPIGTSEWSYVTRQYSSPITIDVTGTDYEGTIYAVCNIKCPTIVVCDEIRVTGGPGGSSIEYFDCNDNFNGFLLSENSQIVVCTHGGLVTQDDAAVEVIGTCGDTGSDIPMKGCGDADVISDEVSWSVSNRTSLGTGDYALVQATAADSVHTYTRARVSFSAHPGADHYTMEYSTDPTYIAGQPPAGGWTPYTSQPIAPAGTYVNFYYDGVGPNPAGLNGILNNNFNEPWIRVSAFDATDTYLASTTFKMITGSSEIPMTASVAILNKTVVVEDYYDEFSNFIWGSTQYDYRGTAIATGYTYYQAQDGIYTPLFTVEATDTPVTILQKLADALNPGSITVTGTSFEISNEFAVGTIYAHA